MGVDVHDLQKEEDERREKVLSEIGLRVVRFNNDEVGRNLSAVVGKIREGISFVSLLSQTHLQARKTKLTKIDVKSAVTKARK